MTTVPDLLLETPFRETRLAAVSPTSLLAAALLHVLDRDEPPPPRWHAEPFVIAVADQRLKLSAVDVLEDLDAEAPETLGSTFGSAVAALASDPKAAALAVRRLELNRRAPMPSWPVIVRRGTSPRLTVEAARWFG